MSGPSSGGPSPINPTFDRSKWNALVSYDKEVSAFADEIRPLGQKWLDELAFAYMSLGDNAYLPTIVAKIKERAEAERKEQQEQEELLRQKQEQKEKEEAERERIRQEQTKRLFEERQKEIQDARRRAEERYQKIKAFLLRNRWVIAVTSIVVIAAAAAVFRYAGWNLWAQHSNTDATSSPVSAQPALAVTPSFDCSRAQTWAANQICQHQNLADLDNRMASLYRQRMAEITNDSKSILRLSQRVWIKKREQCGSAPDSLGCLQKQFKARIASLSVPNNNGTLNVLMEVYPWDLVEAFPQIATAWHTILPPFLSSEDWAGDLKGVGSPIKIVSINGRNYYLGSICKPHDCWANYAAFLIATNGRSAVASVFIGSGPKTVYGAATPHQVMLLNQLMANSSH